MSKMDALRYGAPGAGAVHLCVDMQRMFAEGTEWKMPWLERVELTGKFGGATSFIRAPGLGLWRSGDETQRDNIAVIEVMAGQLEPEYWKRLRERLERELSQDEVVIRAQEIRQL